MEGPKLFERRLERRFRARRRRVATFSSDARPTQRQIRAALTGHRPPPAQTRLPHTSHCTRSLSHAQRGRPAATPGLHLQTRTFKQLAGSLSDPLNDFTLDIWNVDLPFPSPLYVVAGRKYPTRPCLRRLLFSGVRRSILMCGRISERPSVSSDAAPATSYESPSLPLPFRV